MFGADGAGVTGEQGVQIVGSLARPGIAFAYVLGGLAQRAPIESCAACGTITSSRIEGDVRQKTPFMPQRTYRSSAFVRVHAGVLRYVHVEVGHSHLRRRKSPKSIALSGKKSKAMHSVKGNTP